MLIFVTSIVYLYSRIQLWAD